MNFGCWNIRGLNALDKQLVVRNLIWLHKLSIMCIQESKMSNIPQSVLDNLGRPLIDKWISCDAVGQSGGVLLGWNTNVWGMRDYKIGCSSVSLVLTHTKDNNSWLLTNGYCPNDSNEKLTFWQELSEARLCYPSLPWLLCGDFNATILPSDRKNTIGSRRDNNHLISFINDNALLDLPLNGRRFTWTNNHSPPVFARLDRFLANSEWCNQFQNAFLTACPNASSDHCPLLLKCDSSNSKKSVFRFEISWSLDNSFNELLALEWHSIPSLNNGMFNMASKLRRIRSFCRSWSSNKSNSRKAKFSSILDIIDTFERKAEVSDHS